MFIVKDGYIYVGVSLLLAAIVYYFFGAVWAVIPVVLALYFAYFFRDFHRVTPYDPNILYSPADGTVMGVDEIFDDEYLNEPAIKVTIFLSVFNVHTNRAPLDFLTLWMAVLPALSALAAVTSAKRWILFATCAPSALRLPS